MDWFVGSRALEGLRRNLVAYFVGDGVAGVGCG